MTASPRDPVWHRARAGECAAAAFLFGFLWLAMMVPEAGPYPQAWLRMLTPSGPGGSFSMSQTGMLALGATVLLMVVLGMVEWWRGRG